MILKCELLLKMDVGWVIGFPKLWFLWVLQLYQILIVRALRL